MAPFFQAPSDRVATMIGFRNLEMVTSSEEFDDGWQQAEMFDDESTFYSVKEFEMSDFVVGNLTTDTEYSLKQSDFIAGDNAWAYYASTDLDYGDKEMKSARGRKRNIENIVVPARIEPGIRDFHTRNVIAGYSAHVLEKNDVATILDLHHTDKEVGAVSQSASLAKEEEMHKGLLKIDRLVDEEEVEDDTEIFDQMTANILCQFKLKSQSLTDSHDGVDSNIFDLLCTDMEADSHRCVAEGMQAIDHLLQIDREVDETVSILKCHEYEYPSAACTTDRKERLDVSILQREEQLDNVTVLEDMGVQERKSRYTTSTKLPNVIASMYATDLQIDGCSALVQEKDDLGDILDLHQTDREVSGVKLYAVQTKQEEMHLILWKIDQLVDQKEVDDDTEFVDPLTAHILHQHEIQTESLLHCVNPDTFDLLCVDMEVDNCKIQIETMLSIVPLLLVDQEVDTAAAKLKYCIDFRDVRDLFTVDQEVEKMQKTFKKGTGAACTTRNLHLPRCIIDLYTTDLEVDGRTTSIQEEDDIKSIISLHKVDFEVDAANRCATTSSFAFDNSEDEKITRVLLQADRLVDTKQIGDHAEFVDNSKDQMMRQHVAQAIALAERSDQRVPETLDLLSTDLEVDRFGLNCETMDVIKPLLDVDREVDIAELSSQWRKSVSDILQFLKTDIECASDDEPWKGPALECIKDSTPSDKQVFSSHKYGSKGSKKMGVIQNKDFQINGLTARELSTTEQEVDCIKHNAKEICRVDLKAEQVKPTQEMLRVSSRSIFSVKEKAAARRHSFIGGKSQKPAVLQTASIINEREAMLGIVKKSSKKESKVVDVQMKAGRNEVIPNSSLQEAILIKHMSLPIRFTEMAVPAQIPFDKHVPRRSIFSNKEKFYARSKGEHLL